MRYAALFVSLWFAAGSASADLALSRNLSTNDSGQVTAHYGSQISPLFDLFIDIQNIQNIDSNSICQSGDPCLPANSGDTNTLTSTRTFDSGYFKMSFQALLNGNPLTVTGAGLNQQETNQYSLFDVYFNVDLGNGATQEGALGIRLAPQPPPIIPPIIPLTTEGTIGWKSAPNPPPIRQSTFELDPWAYESFDITIQSALTLPDDPPPPLDPNPNVVTTPEPSYLAALAGMVAALLAASRFAPSKRSNQP